jgi:FAD synthase
VRGAGRGRSLRAPTLNLDLRDVPAELAEGIYACTASWGGGPAHFGALHYGPRPVFKDTVACEVHVLDQVIDKAPERVTVQVVERLRAVKDFPSKEDLMKQIQEDVRQVRDILGQEPNPKHQ